MITSCNVNYLLGEGVAGVFDLAAAGQMRKQMAQRDQQWPSESPQHLPHLAKGVQPRHLGAEGDGLHLGEEGVREVGALQREEGVHHPAVDMEALQNRETEWTQVLNASTCRALDTCTATVAALVCNGQATICMQLRLSAFILPSIITANNHNDITLLMISCELRERKRKDNAIRHSI